MNGVNVLNVETIYEFGYLWWLIPALAAAGFVIGIIYSIKEWCNTGFDGADLVGVLVLTIACGFVGFIGAIISEHETDVVDHIEYKVTVSDDVNFTEFMSKYEIVDQEGLIYTVKEREEQ